MSQHLIYYILETLENIEIPWQGIAGMRDKLIHDYFGVDIETVWLTVEKDIPDFK